MDYTGSLQSVLNEFGTPAVVSLSGALNTASVVYLSGPTTTGLSGTRMESAEPLAYARATDLIGLVRGDAMLINEVWWFVRDVRPDTTGGVYLHLSQDVNDNRDQDQYVSFGTFQETPAYPFEVFSFTESEPTYWLVGGDF